VAGSRGRSAVTGSSRSIRGEEMKTIADVNEVFERFAGKYVIVRGKFGWGYRPILIGPFSSLSGAKKRFMEETSPDGVTLLHVVEHKG